MTLHYRDGRPYPRRVFLASGKPVGVLRLGCSRCGGAGGSDRWKHTGWTCYQCQGSGKGPVKRIPLYTLPELEKLNAAQAKAAATRAAKLAAKQAAAAEAKREAEAARAADLEKDPHFQRALQFVERSEFVADVVSGWRSREISEKALAAVNAACDRIEARDRELAASQAAGWVGEIDGRVEVEGTVTLAKCIHVAEGYWDVDRYLIKIRRADGAMFSWFTGSTSYAEGDRVRGKARVKKHDEFRGEKSTVIGNFRAAKGLTPAAPS